MLQTFHRLYIKKIVHVCRHYSAASLTRINLAISIYHKYINEQTVKGDERCFKTKCYHNRESKGGKWNREKKHEEQGRGKKKGGTTEWGGKMDERKW